jgi:hypothetical protein
MSDSDELRAASAVLGRPDWRNETAFTDEERNSMLDAYAVFHGFGNLDMFPFPRFWAHNDAATLQRYRRHTAMIGVGGAELGGIMLAWIHTYVALPYPAGILYEMLTARKLGHSKSEVLATLSAAFMFGGTYGANAAADTTERYLWEWTDNGPSTVVWPPGWRPDPTVFDCQLDMTNDDLSPSELRRLEGWYERIYREVPQHVRFMAKHSPRLLKAYRHRWTNAFGNVLPPQAAPMFELHTAALKGDSTGLRMGARLANGLGLTQAQVVSITAWGSVYGGHVAMEKIAGILDEEFTNWTAR